MNLAAYTDTLCSQQVPISVTSCSGIDTYYHNEEDHGCTAAAAAVSGWWRPQCLPCQVGQAWIEFTTPSPALCIISSNDTLGDGEADLAGLGAGSGGGLSWSGGLTITASIGLEFTNEDPNTLLLSYSDGKTAISVPRHQ